MLKVRIFEVDFGKEEVVLNLKDAKDLGLRAQDRVKIIGKKSTTVALINITNSFVKEGQIGVFSRVKEELQLKDNDNVDVELVDIPESVSFIKRKLSGQKLSKEEIDSIIGDTVERRLSLIDLTAFVSGLYTRGMDMDEVEHLTRAMTNSGEILKIKKETYDKHSLGGCPGDKTTLIVTPIVAAAGLTIPKTSSRAITSPAGTADRMEVFAPVCHDIDSILKIVKKTNGCIVWGGAVNLAPADDALIQIEYPLSLDPRPLLLASVMSKKFAVSANFVVIDIPLGPGTKIQNNKDAKELARDFLDLGERLGIRVECALTYGAQPIGSAMGPALEAREALETLKGTGPNSLIEKASSIAGIILEAGGVATKNNGEAIAKEFLADGKALEKFREIVEAQGGNPDVRVRDIRKVIGKNKTTIKAKRDGYVTKIFNRKIANVAKVAGAPHDKGAGVVLHSKGGDSVKKNGKLFTIYAEKKYKLDRAVALANRTEPVLVEGMLLEEIPSTFIGRH